MTDLPPRQWLFEIHTDRLLLLRGQADQVADLPPRQWQFKIHNDRILL